MVRKFGDIGISKTLLAMVTRIYTLVPSNVHTTHGLSYFIRVPLGLSRVARSCYQYLEIGIYINELESYYREHIQDGDV